MVMRSIGELLVLVTERELKCGLFMMVKRRRRRGGRRMKKKGAEKERKAKSVTMAEGFGVCRERDGYWFFG